MLRTLFDRDLDMSGTAPIISSTTLHLQHVIRFTADLLRIQEEGALQPGSSTQILRRHRQQ